jgi:hypothetical protein
MILSAKIEKIGVLRMRSSEILIGQRGPQARSAPTKPTTTAQVPALEEYIREHHARGIPDIVVTPIVGSDAEHLKWIDGQVARSTP